VTELASLAGSTPFARISLLRLADSDRNEAVRGFADTMARQSQQPSLRRLLDDGVIPPDVWKAAVNDPDLPQLLHHPGGRVPVGVDAPDGQDSCRPRHTVTVAAYLRFPRFHGGY
jgi:formylglycine-generating enzyme required for sulfatase activity